MSDPRTLNVPHVVVGAVRVAPLTRSEICSIVVDDCSSRCQNGDGPDRARLLFSSNGQTLALAARNEEFRTALAQADLVHADGQAIVFGSKRIPGHSVPERSATTDLIHDLCLVARDKELSIFLLGAAEEVNVRCAEALGRLYPGLKIAGRRNGYFRLEEEQAVCDQINASGADIVWVGLGKPKEQLFCLRNRERLGATWAITCGGCFNFVTGEYRRAPKWMQSAGLEWLYRALSNPRKFLWRYLATNPLATFLILTKTRAGDFDKQGTV